MANYNVRNYSSGYTWNGFVIGIKHLRNSGGAGHILFFNPSYIIVILFVKNISLDRQCTYYMYMCVYIHIFFKSKFQILKIVVTYEK